MPINDCGWCDLLLNCNAGIDKIEFQKLVAKLLCQIETNTSVDANETIQILCDPGTGDKVVVRLQFGPPPVVSAYYLATGAEYEGDIEALVICDDVENYATEYPICDNGVSKIARVCWSGCTPATATYFTADRVASTVPADFSLVTYGFCPLIQEPIGTLARLTSADEPYTIPEGCTQLSIALYEGTATINGTEYPQGFVLNLPPMSFGNFDRLYEEYVIDDIAGTVIVYYTTLMVP